MTASPRPTVVVLHDLGDAGGGAGWPPALTRAGWPGTVLAPDLPGHAGAPTPTGGHYELADPAFTFSGLGLVEPVDLVVGCGASGWAAQLVALGGRARSVALVDGSGAPWRDRHDQLDAVRERLRALARLELDDRTPVDVDGLDPPLRHPPLLHGSRALAARALQALPVPVLIVETPRSPTSVRDVDHLVESVGPTCTVERLDTEGVDAVATAIVSWSASASR
jgi:hypothetical protein